MIELFPLSFWWSISVWHCTQRACAGTLTWGTELMSFSLNIVLVATSCLVDEISESLHDYFPFEYCVKQLIKADVHNFLLH